MDLPQLEGYSQAEANRIRNAYIQYINNLEFTKQHLSWIEAELIIDQFAEQKRLHWTEAQRTKLIDAFYYIYAEEHTDGKYHLKTKCQSLGYSALTKLKKTTDWLELKSKASFYDLTMRCIAYHFKTSKTAKKVLDSFNNK